MTLATNKALLKMPVGNGRDDLSDPNAKDAALGSASRAYPFVNCLSLL